MLTCQLSNRKPHPPETTLARYPVPTSDRELLSHQAYLDVLTESYTLSDAESKALAYTRAGWPVWELQEVMYEGPRVKGELVKRRGRHSRTRNKDELVRDARQEIKQPES
jgi:hypothetical protein